MSMTHSDNDTEAVTRSKKKVKAPDFYKVVLLNDDFTPMEFVVDLIIKFFSKSAEEATEIMLSIHHEGFGVCGVYPRDIAETKMNQVNQFARQNGHPLKCRIERN
ncbi:MAG: ATP-dependent Clp protease adapter ClpS [Magnetococcales bacterium]|nr:ATP-dependent Clp protease adapter ClpS [Magnetococcales bacterium]